MARPGTGRVGRAGDCPRINASVWAGRYDGKVITTSDRCDWLPFLVFRTSSLEVQRFLIIVVDFSEQILSQYWPCQTLRDHKGIVPECFEDFAQDIGLFGVRSHAIHFSL